MGLVELANLAWLMMMTGLHPEIEGSQDPALPTTAYQHAEHHPAPPTDVAFRIPLLRSARPIASTPVSEPCTQSIVLARGANRVASAGAPADYADRMDERWWEVGY